MSVPTTPSSPDAIMVLFSRAGIVRCGRRLPIRSLLDSFKCMLLAISVVLGPCAIAGNSIQQLRDLEAAVADNPGSASNIRELAHSYALALLQADPNVARYAAVALDKSQNVWILGNAAYMLQSQYNETLQRGTPNERAAMLAERYFQRARILDPRLERNAILPRIDLTEIARRNKIRAQEEREWARRFEEAARHIRRLDPEAFPGLPRDIASFLRARGCTVPQPSGVNSPRNVVRGEFFEAGRESWAVLCSVKSSSTILVFRNDRDATPQELAQREDRFYLQSLDERTVGYSREIQAVGRAFIVSHDRGYPVAKPPQISHDGIDDSFLEKASEVWYFHAGNWFKLPGAD